MADFPLNPRKQFHERDAGIGLILVGPGRRIARDQQLGLGQYLVKIPVIEYWRLQRHCLRSRSFLNEESCQVDGLFQRAPAVAAQPVDAMRYDDAAAHAAAAAVGVGDAFRLTAGVRDAAA